MGNLERNATIKDLSVSHDILLKKNMQNINKDNFNELKNLRQSQHYIYYDNDQNSYILDINVKGYYHNSDFQGHNHGIANDDTLENEFNVNIKGKNLQNKVFNEKINGFHYVFIASTLKKAATGNYYLVSYSKIINDYNLIFEILLIGFLFCLIGFITSLRVGKYLSKPLKELEEYAVHISNRSWIKPLEVKTEDEIGRLMTAMNDMQYSLRHSEEEERMFFQSISHDLKTPVMVIMSHAEAIIDGICGDSVEETALIIKEEAMRLDKKIKQILYLNTLDYMFENNSEALEFNLEELIQNISGRFSVINTLIEWKLDLEEVYLLGNEEKIQIAIENILDNQLRYAKEEISIRLKSIHDAIVLEIYNDGPPIDEQKLKHIFDYLYKDKTGNFGLGLAISKKIIHFYGGDLSVVNQNVGVSFFIKFKISPNEKK